MHTHCFYQPPAAAGYAMGCIVDFINPKTGLSEIGGSTQEQIAARYPGVEVWLIDAAINFREQVGRTEPQEITPKRGRPVTTGTTPAKDRKAKSRAAAAQEGGKRLHVMLTPEGAQHLQQIMDDNDVGLTRAVHIAIERGR